jgi:hypothetical protein
MIDGISTGKAMRILHFPLSAKSFRVKYAEIFTHDKTKGGHYRWSRAEILEAAGKMAPKPIKNGR